MLLPIIRVACVICLFAPPCVALSMTSAQAQTASSTQPAGKAAKKKPVRKSTYDTGRSLPAAPSGSSESSYGGVPAKHDARHGY